MLFCTLQNKFTAFKLGSNAFATDCTSVLKNNISIATTTKAHEGVTTSTILTEN